MKRLALFTLLIVVLASSQASAQVSRARRARYRELPPINTYEAVSETDLPQIDAAQPYSTRFNVDRYRSDAIYIEERVPVRYIPTHVRDEVTMVKVPARQRRVWVEPSDQQKYLSGKFSLYQRRGHWERRHAPGFSVPAVQMKSVPAHFRYE